MAGGRIVLADTGAAFFQALGGEKHSYNQNVIANPEIIDSLIEKLGNNWFYCPGIPEKIYENLTPNIRYTPSGHVIQRIPRPAIYSRNCTHWYKRQRQGIAKMAGIQVCKSCRTLLNNSIRSNDRNAIDRTKKLERINPSSKYNLKFLSPTSRKIRLKNKRQVAWKNEEKIRKLQDTIEKQKVTLENEQNNEMADIVKIINSKYQDQLENIWQESTASSSADTTSVLRNIWEQDSKDRQQFFHVQSKNVTSSKGNTWSTVTYRIALAVYIRSPAAYEALRSFKILQLPSVTTLKTFKGPRLHQPGINRDIQEYIQEQQVNYTKYKSEVQQRGQNQPLGEGILIFDEVKVTAKVKWNSASQKILGLALSADEFSYLDDVYDQVNPARDPLPAEYNIQFLWRDISSDFDVVGPYFSSASSYDHRFVIAAIKETMRIFHAFDFLVIGLVCDGASTNLAAIKLMCHKERGAFRRKDEQIHPHGVQPWFNNYFMPTLKTYCCICPSHQLKNMINALYQSRDTPGGTKLFKLEQQKQYFGWRAIQDMYTRESTKQNHGELRIVPGLLRSHIDRDPWTKLAVYPAKIMQVNLSH